MNTNWRQRLTKKVRREAERKWYAEGGGAELKYTLGLVEQTHFETWCHKQGIDITRPERP